MPPVRLEGPRIFLRPPHYDDSATWIALREKNQDHLKPFEPLWPEDALTPEHFERRLARQAADWKINRSRSFLIFRRADDSMIGGMNINNIALGASQFGSLGYWLAADQQGHGYMQEALQLTAHYAFTEINLHRLNAGCVTHNARSRNLLLRAGFREEGYAEKYIEINGKWEDHILFGLPVENWLATIEAALRRAQPLQTTSPDQNPGI